MRPMSFEQALRCRECGRDYALADTFPHEPQVKLIGTRSPAQTMLLGSRNSGKFHERSERSQFGWLV